MIRFQVRVINKEPYVARCRGCVASSTMSANAAGVRAAAKAFTRFPIHPNHVVTENEVRLDAVDPKAPYVYGKPILYWATVKEGL